MKALEFLFIAVLTIWLVGLIGRWLLRMWIVRKQREFSQRFGGAQYGGQNRGQNRGQSASDRRNPRKEGEIKVQRTAPEEKKVSKAVGEYVEFEEVEITEEIYEKE